MCHTFHSIDEHVSCLLFSDHRIVVRIGYTHMHNALGIYLSSPIMRITASRPITKERLGREKHSRFSFMGHMHLQR